MARSPDDRFAHASALARAVDAWLDGAQRQARGRLVMARAEELASDIAAAADEAARLESRAAAVRETIAAWQPASVKESY